MSRRFLHAVIIPLTYKTAILILIRRNEKKAMNKLHYAAKSINVLNCLLILALAAAAQRVIVTFPNAKPTTSFMTTAKANPEPAELPASPPDPSFADYIAVSENNLFHPERIIPPDKKVEPIAVIPKPDLVLYGTLIADNLSIAYVEDRKAPYATPGRGTRQQQLKEGDGIGGYILREIGPSRIVLVRGEEKMVVMLDEKGRKRGGEPAAHAAATSAPGGLPPSPAVPAASVPSAATSPAASAAPAAAQGEKSPVRPGPASTRPAAPVYDPRRIRMQNK